jgi:hypothetical protein
VSERSVAAESSLRVAEARLRADERRARRRARLRPLGWLAIAIVAAAASAGTPAPGLSGEALGVSLALAASVVAVVASMADDRREQNRLLRYVPPLLVGAAGLALAALQPQGLVEVAPSVAVWIAVARFPFRFGVGIAAGIVVGPGHRDRDDQQVPHGRVDRGVDAALRGARDLRVLHATGDGEQ